MSDQWRTTLISIVVVVSAVFVVFGTNSKVNSLEARVDTLIIEVQKLNRVDQRIIELEKELQSIESVQDEIRDLIRRAIRSRNDSR